MEPSKWHPSMQLVVSRGGRPWLLEDVGLLEPPQRPKPDHQYGQPQLPKLKHQYWQPQRPKRIRKCPVHPQDLPWPKRCYYRECRWCGVEVSSTRPSKQQLTVCEPCSHGTCSRCGDPMFIVLNSKPPQSRVCRRCRADIRDTVKARYGRPIDREALLARVLGGGVRD